ncbi:sigma-70 family RNA polymerase sigma factor [Adhaeretor mobilis]|uniref:RNA polymerase sigma factor n=1 Tax=Adhaeretor mobilis TaxID=1930276 RepID=A0A517MUP9_9BACT|nr:sigma-70 family RNA polymerase sigma factor [Adhaeretor mobilis]QDS98614.1 RNA polymerase sigma factor [Adhaeretor mobilis]
MATPDLQEMFITYHARHQRAIFSFILTLVPNWTDAEEILQETSLVLWRKFSSFKPGTSYRAWATQVARFEVCKFRDRQKKADKLLSDEVLEQLAVQAIEMSDLLDSQDGALQGCLKRLRDDDQKLIRSRYLHGSSTSALATSLGRSVESICNSLRRIRGALLHCVQQAT